MSTRRQLVTRVDDLFAGLGKSIARHPFLVLTTVLLVFGGLGVGLLEQTKQNDIYELWVEKDSSVRQERAFLETNLIGSDSRESLLEAHSKNRGSNVLTSKALREFLHASQRIVSLAAFKSVCVFNASDSTQLFNPNERRCINYSPLLCYREGNFESTADEFATRPSIVAPQNQILNAVNDTALQCTGYLGPLLPTPENLILGGVTRDATGNVEHAESLQYVVRSMSSLSLAAISPSMDQAQAEQFLLDFEQAFLDECARIAADPLYEELEFTYWAQRTTGDLVTMAGNADSELIIAGYALMLGFVCLTAFRFNVVTSHILAATCGLALVLLSMIAALGVSALAGIEATPSILQVLPFLALGLGCDDMFVMLHCFKSNSQQSPEEVVGSMLREAGVSITLTSTVNLIAFLVASTFPLPAVSGFALAAAIVVAINYLALLFGFTAVLAFDARRIFARRYDVFLCMSNHSATLEEKESKTSLEYKTVNAYTNFLLHPVSMVICLLGFGTILGFGIYGATKLEDGLQASDIVPKDSFASRFLEAREEWYFTNLVSLVVGLDENGNAVRDFDYPNQFDQLLALQQDIAASRFVSKELPMEATTWSLLFVNVFIPGLKEQFPALAPIVLDAEQRLPKPEYFYIVFSLFYRNAPSFRTSFDVQINGTLRETPLAAIVDASPLAPEIKGVALAVFESTPQITRIDASTMSVVFTNMKTPDDIKELIRDVRGKLDKSELPAFPSMLEFSIWEQYLNLRDRLQDHTIYVFIGVFGVSLLFFLNLWTPLIMLAVILMIFFEVYGFLDYFDIKLNGVCVVNLIMAIGVSVEFTAHTTHAFMIARGSRENRVHAAMQRMMYPVILGASSTIIGIAPLAFAEFPYFRLYFFYMFVLIVALGLANGLILLPILLRIFGPAEERKGMHESPLKSSSNDAVELDISPVAT